MISLYLLEMCENVNLNEHSFIMKKKGGEWRK
jgi:hypothetical protein